MRRSLSLVTPTLRRDPVASRAFLDVLAQGQRPYRVLSIMNETGLLGRFLPEWGRIVGQTQFNMYHAYTVDEHTLQAIGLINDIQRGKLAGDHPLATQIVHRVDDFEALMLAMLLHDVGKGGDRGQVEDGALAARRACERLGVDSRRIELVCWLVRHHLVLSDYAQKRDTSDPATVRAFAGIVGDPERLRLLLILTVADIRAVGPGVWNSWKGRLMRDLYSRTQALFRGEAVDAPDAAADHPALVARAAAGGAAVEALPVEADEAVARVAVAAPDRPGLFADLASALAAAGADVVGARVATTPRVWRWTCSICKTGRDCRTDRRSRDACHPAGRPGRRRARTGGPRRPCRPRRQPAPRRLRGRAGGHGSARGRGRGGRDRGLRTRPSGPAGRPRRRPDRGGPVDPFGPCRGLRRPAVDSFLCHGRGRRAAGQEPSRRAHDALVAVLDRPVAARPVASARASARDVSEIGPFRPARKRAKG